MMRLTFLFTIIIFFSQCKGTVDTVRIYSSSMSKLVKCVVIKPEEYANTQRRYPVVYLLHGHGDSYKGWIKHMPSLQQLASKNKMIIVCPDGGYGSWYFDSPVDPAKRYETNVAIEIPRYIDSIYRTVPDRKARAITGSSMGGHGAMFIGLRHANIFGACGSISGVMDLHVLHGGLDLDKTLGDTIVNQAYYKDWSVLNMVENYPKDSLAVVMDCGTEDWLFPSNKATHNKMTALKFPHEYLSREGGHTLEYAIPAVRYQLQFFRKYFDRGKD
jgi:S-formylglutathione hydrolase FrmB